MAGGRDAVALCVDVVVVGGGIRRKYFVWLAIHPAMAGLRKEGVIGGPGIFLAIELLGKCFEPDLRDASGQRAVTVGCCGLAVYLWTESSFIKAVPVSGAKRRTTEANQCAAQPGTGVGPANA